MERQSERVASSSGVELAVQVMEPPGRSRMTIVVSHPHTLFGGSSQMMLGLARELVLRGHRCVMVDLRGANGSGGAATWTGWGAEVDDWYVRAPRVGAPVRRDRCWPLLAVAGRCWPPLTVAAPLRPPASAAVCEWAKQRYGTPVAIIGSSGAAPFAATACAQCDACNASVSIGYVFGRLCSVLWGRHYAEILQSPKPKLFIMGSKDEHTSVAQLTGRVVRAKQEGLPAEMHVFHGVGHYELEQPRYDAPVAGRIHEWLLHDSGLLARGAA